MVPAPRLSAPFSRRQFFRTAAAAAAAAALPRFIRAANSGPLPIIGSGESFKFLGPSELARFAQVVGWTGMAASVRQAGQIEPEHVRDDLPIFFDALQGRGLELPLVMTDATSLREISTEGVLRQTAKLGIKHICLGGWKLDSAKPIERQKEIFARDLRDVCGLCQELDLHPSLENQVNPAYFGTDVRDLVEVIRAAGGKAGIFFNPGHAVLVQGGVREQGELAQPLLAGGVAEDFLPLEVSIAHLPKSCPLGDGITPPSYFRSLRSTGFSGLICQRFDYPLGNNQSILAHGRADLATIQQWLGQYVASPFL